MPQVVVTDAKGLFQQSGSGIVFPKDAKALVNFKNIAVQLVPAAADAAGVSYGGKYFVICGPTGKYQFYFSSIGGTTQTVPDQLAGHELVSIGNIASDAAATAVATAIGTAVGAGDSAGVAELTVRVNSATVTIGSVLPGAQSGVSNLGTLDATHLTTFTTLSEGAGEDTPTLSLRPGAINVLQSIDYLNASNVLNNDDNTGLDSDHFLLGDGDYIGQEITIARENDDTSVAEPAMIVEITKMRDIDGGAIQTATVTFEASATDGSQLLKCIWDGQAWQYIGNPTITHMGFSGIATG